MSPQLRTPPISLALCTADLHSVARSPNHKPKPRRGQKTDCHGRVYVHDLIEIRWWDEIREKLLAECVLFRVLIPCGQSDGTQRGTLKPLGAGGHGTRRAHFVDKGRKHYL
jgi:hypothetical protein